MSWQRSIQAAIRSLKRDEASLNKKLAVTRAKIRELQSLAKSNSGGGKTPANSGPRRLSTKGRAAISRAAKKRWAEYRRQKRQSERRR